MYMYVHTDTCSRVHNVLNHVGSIQIFALNDVQIKRQVMERRYTMQRSTTQWFAQQVCAAKPTVAEDHG